MIFFLFDLDSVPSNRMLLLAVSLGCLTLLNPGLQENCCCLVRARARCELGARLPLLSPLEIPSSSLVSGLGTR